MKIKPVDFLLSLIYTRMARPCSATADFNRTKGPQKKTETAAPYVHLLT